MLLPISQAPALANDGPANPASAAAPAFVPADFTVPRLVEGPGFKLVPLGPDLVKIDYDAYMSSIEHLQKTFSRSDKWPRQGITDADAIEDMNTEAARFAARKSFAYAVLSPDGKRERGSVYLRPSPIDGYDAAVSLWVTKAEYDAGFDARLYAWVTRWVKAKWPFRQVAYPGRKIDWKVWDAALAAKKAKSSGQ
jgi:hypothetical protein